MSDVIPQTRDNLSSLELRLPPLPRTLPQVLKLLHEPGFVGVEDMAEVAQRDPAVAAGLLKHINSAYYGLRRSITSVERAIQMIGPTSAAGTVIGLSILRMEDLMQGPASSCFTRLVRHSEGVALLTRYLLDQLPPVDGTPSGSREEVPDDDGFTEGLMHDFGKLVLIYNYPERAVALYEDRVYEDYFEDVGERELEQLVFGHDHTEAGAYAANEMNFPRSLVDLIRYHHDPNEASLEGEAERRFKALCAANLASKAMGPAFNGVRASEQELDVEACTEHPIWDHWSSDPDTDRSHSPKKLLEDLRAKGRDVILFTDFFLVGPDAWIKAHSLA